MGAPDFAERRQYPRVGVAWLATLKAGLGVFDCMVIDVSKGGAKLAFTDPFPSGGSGAATLDLGTRGVLRAEIVWRRTMYCGLRFLDAPDRVAAVLEGAIPD
ncbi:MAG: PilZ domain-containing protein [Stellaceae bacterium]